MCAKVRVRIVQELVLIREGFNARLEIENGEQSALENIFVEIVIRETYGSSSELVNERFSIGNILVHYFCVLLFYSNGPRYYFLGSNIKSSRRKSKIYMVSFFAL